MAKQPKKTAVTETSTTMATADPVLKRAVINLVKKTTEEKPVVKAEWKSGLPTSLAFCVESYAANVGKDEALSLAARLLQIGDVKDITWAYCDIGNKNGFLDDYNNARSDSAKINIEDIKRQCRALV